ncbi:hypothetical protein [Phaeovulum vinaykumarii]|uniref:Uncharacterized protein n=2 Tax=Phaeovulum vinaykumarii TaxID=407234 RepID=A0A1N7JIF6_9RHOB|nr:hypothetical protein [Phaeovulum vinaykumarii]SIS49115.1 hypothetical protein SAMN05421795_1017 [Phaeovulum vinaykumarii]SOB89405.1 hypothetical protein SAMN05878426_1017 [Phaeovulum vinaykumarii]
MSGMSTANRIMHGARQSATVLACLRLILWSLVPAASHVPDVSLVLAEHAEMVEKHGHSHGLEDDLAWALRGHHSHDAADHDHSQAVLLPMPNATPWTQHSTRAPVVRHTRWTPPVHLLERPPRV